MADTIINAINRIGARHIDPDKYQIWHTSVYVCSECGCDTWMCLHGTVATEQTVRCRACNAPIAQQLRLRVEEATK